MIYESDLYISHRDFRYRAAPSAKAWLFCALLLATGPRASCIHEPALVRADAIYLTIKTLRGSCENLQQTRGVM